MIDLGKHHLDAIATVANATNETHVDVLARAIVELGVCFTPGALSGWLWQERITLGLERRSAHRDSPKQVAAWTAIETNYRDSEEQMQITEMDE